MPQQRRYTTFQRLTTRHPFHPPPCSIQLHCQHLPAPLTRPRAAAPAQARVAMSSAEALLPAWGKANCWRFPTRHRGQPPSVIFPALKFASTGADPPSAPARTAPFHSGAMKQSYGSRDVNYGIRGLTTAKQDWKAHAMSAQDFDSDDMFHMSVDHLAGIPHSLTPSPFLDRLDLKDSWQPCPSTRIE
jgi:hypothetical protein